MKKCTECNKEHNYYRQPCLACKPKQKPGRRSYGKRYQHAARLTYEQLEVLKSKYGSLQEMADELLV